MLAIDSTHDQAFLADLHAARLHALGVLRSILNLATLTPEARAEFLKTGRAALALLRESRLAAAQILNLQLPLPEAHSKNPGRVVGSKDSRQPHTPNTPPRATTSPRDHPSPRHHPAPTTPPTAHLNMNPRHPAPDIPIQHILVDAQPLPHHPLTQHTHPTPAAQLRARAGAAP